MKEFCPVCGSNVIDQKSAYRGSHPVFTGLTRARCAFCGMFFVSPMPDKAALDSYNASYFFNAHGGHTESRSTNSFFSGIARLRLKHIEKYLQERKILVSSILEIGAGPGFFAATWMRKYPECEYVAIETDVSCHATLKDSGVSRIETSTNFVNSHLFDLVVMSHVLEHVPNPIEFLTQATRSLRKGGVLFIEVPCRDWEHKPVDEPHLLFFDKNPMVLLLKNLRFSDIRVSYHGQEIERLRLSNPLRNAYQKLRSKLIERGIIRPFAKERPGMEILEDPLERAVLFPYKAHLETNKPAWWLRAVAQKESS